MYEKPRVERFGRFRDLTRVGFTGASDGYIITAIANSDDTGSTGNDLRS